MKLLFVLLLLVLAWRLVTGRWPFQRKTGQLAGARHRRALVQARTLLGVSGGAGRQEIADAHRRLVAQVHPDRGGSNEQVHDANAARDLLLGEFPDPS